MKNLILAATILVSTIIVPGIAIAGDVPKFKGADFSGRFKSECHIGNSYRLAMPEGSSFKFMDNYDGECSNGVSFSFMSPEFETAEDSFSYAKRKVDDATDSSYISAETLTMPGPHVAAYIVQDSTDELSLRAVSSSLHWVSNSKIFVLGCFANNLKTEPVSASLQKSHEDYCAKMLKSLIIH